MNYKIAATVIFIALLTAGISWASGCSETSGNQQQENPKNDPVNIIISVLQIL